VDEPSDKAPGGARGHRVILTKAAAEEALDSLLGMGLNFTPNWDGHDVRVKCGVIMKAWIEGCEVRVSGHVFCRDFPELKKYLKPDSAMGMSYDMADAHVESMRADVWKLTAATFTGAAILLREKAAYRNTSFTITAAAERFTGRLSFIDHGVRTGRAVRT
jgi:hypothetical protein